MEKKTEITKSDWYKALLEDCDSLITEGVHLSRWTLLETYHQLGERILKEIEERGLPLRSFVYRVADDLGRSRQTIYRAVQFVKQYPDLNALPEGKNISWHKLVNRYLPGAPEKEIRHYINCFIDHGEKTIWINSRYKDYKIKYRD